uniref:Prolamin-like domain-containing protein n=1 Tax=Nelumbo nucifera TaxID=4432 RepID=A0A822XTM1_NELNU|nr:TPA_asm: hypothetical protein HUJ06_023984 [Nelumbo nucifera]
MAFSTKLFLLLNALLAWTMLAPAATARSLQPVVSPSLSTSSLSARLQSDSMAQCWESLIEIRACTGEVILFFLNGQTYLGPSCCRAIRFIEHQCWPSMLVSLGFTPEEGDILRGYCDATGSTPPPPPPFTVCSGSSPFCF